jgi:hypothetical protein
MRMIQPMPPDWPFSRPRSSGASNFSMALSPSPTMACARARSPRVETQSRD